MNTNLFLWLLILTLSEIVFSQSNFTTKDVKFKSQGITLAGSILTPKNPIAAVVIVHGSDPVKRKMELTKLT